ncbi:cytochrome c biogenesis protein CcsA [Granulicella sp. 5B5]|uniref:cytochrome c biogenesis protein CcsA n=1 Tax=Granulicella sp. 5B5 TaxID=1617967 RepID=UPI00210342F6|nr:cytochrome c biogenesis protein CcsA [Granulicella sp. 5B5]
MTDTHKSSGFAGILGRTWLVLTFAVMAYGFYVAMTAPTEATMGNLYRVFFYHFPHTILSFVFPYLNLGASLLYLYWRPRNIERANAADAFAVASAELTVLYASVGLATGMLWGRAAWGIWWTWDARLTTYLLLWLSYVSYLLVRRFAAPGQTAIISAALAVFAAADIPICYMSIRWWRTQHPAPVFGGGADSGIDPSMYAAVLWNLAAWAMWGALILGVRYVVERRRQRIAAARALGYLESDLATGTHFHQEAGR